jgi:tetratricopeptide (TPR) repeat protein
VASVQLPFQQGTFAPLWQKLRALFPARSVLVEDAGPRRLRAITHAVNELVTLGKIEDAMRVVQHALRRDAHDPDLNEMLFALCGLKGDAAKTLAQGAACVKAMLAAGREDKALAFFKSVREVDASFMPDADSTLPLAKAAVAARELPVAVSLLSGFDKRHPGHADIPAVYFLAARVSTEHLSQDAKAIAILKVLLHRYPKAAVSAEAQNYLLVLRQFAAAS